MATGIGGAAVAGPDDPGPVRIENKLYRKAKRVRSKYLYRRKYAMVKLLIISLLHAM
jgi:hypothetical protein